MASQRDRQAAGSERIERAGMASALGGKQPLHDGNGLRRRHPDRLVKHDPAVNVALVAPRLTVLALHVAGTRIAAVFCLVALRTREIIFF